MRQRVALTVVGLAGAAVLVGQMNAGTRLGKAVESAGPVAGAGGGGVAGGGIGPDVIVGALNGIQTWGTVDGITGYSIGTTSCNIGDEDAIWLATVNQHPVIAQNIYRLEDGRFEQLGQSWLKHSFTAVNNGICGQCNGHLGATLGVGCSDPYGAALNGDQNGFPCGDGVCSGGLGPRSEVNATTGFYLWPYGSAGQSGNAPYKRCQVHADDVAPTTHPDALFYGEGHYVTPDDAAAGNHHNNASYRKINIGGAFNGGYIMSLTGPTTRELPAIYAWRENDSEVIIIEIEDDSNPDVHDGRFHLGFLVSDNGDGTWHYEYALYNLNSHRSARLFTVPVPPGVTVTNVGFHDVDSHSGEPYDLTDWASTVGAGVVKWETDLYSQNVFANALRWGTLYNFRFDADSPPKISTATIGIFRPGLPAILTPEVLGPANPAEVCPWDLDGDGMVGVTDLLALLAVWLTDPGGLPDFDDNGNVGVPDLLIMLGQWGPCPAVAHCGDSDGGSCFADNGTPGCNQNDCCETVCSVRSTCCSIDWDATCADLAATMCGNCGDAGAGDCCQANGTPGCDDAGCCATVCAVDSFCCVGEWDTLCATQAASLCGCP